MKIGLVIPTYNAGEKFISLLESIEQQSYQIERKVVIDSNSTDETVCLAKRYDYEVIRIAKKEFNHGRTRQLAVEYLSFYVRLICSISRKCIASCKWIS